MENFTPLSALAGGALIGLAAVLLMALTGRIAGISGLFGGLLTKTAWRVDRDGAFRLAFVAGLMLAPAVYVLFHPLPPIELSVGVPGLILAGLLVGIGTRMGSGCTSGHGVCGLARFSKRSLAATVTFMAAGMLTVFITRHVFGMGG